MSSFLLMGSSYAAGRPFHIIADARAAFERLVKGLTEGCVRTTASSDSFAPETPPRPQPQLPPEARSILGLMRLRVSAKRAWCEIKWPIHSFQTQLYEPNISFICDPGLRCRCSSYLS